jgi:hypothetical protein
MSLPDLAVLAEGDLATGEHWILKAGGTHDEFYTLLETIHPDGHRDEGGMGGPCSPRPPAWSRSPRSTQAARCWNLRICLGTK